MKKELIFFIFISLNLTFNSFYKIEAISYPKITAGIAGSISAIEFYNCYQSLKRVVNPKYSETFNTDLYQSKDHLEVSVVTGLISILCYKYS